MGFLIGELLDAGLLHDDVRTVWGTALSDYCVEAKLERTAMSVGNRRRPPRTIRTCSALPPIRSRRPGG